MQLKYLLLALTGQSALAALQTFTFDDGTTIEADPESVVSPHSPNNAKSSRTVDSSPAGAKMLLARSCPQPEYPNTCQGGNLCCQTDDFCCEGQSCVDPDIHNCCLYGYYCEKPYRCVKYDNGNIGCMQ
ncbi:hypothetical protein BDW62DRAFT_194119 [Aspergillus aurantiobrunneus]